MHIENIDAFHRAASLRAQSERNGCNVETCMSVASKRSDHLIFTPVNDDFVKESWFRRRLCDVGRCLQVIFLSVQLINQMKEVISKGHANVVS